MIKKNGRKKKWISPVITVVMRGKPEEKVLAACKIPGGAPGGQNNTYLACMQTHNQPCFFECYSSTGS